ncbi:MAG TPA: peptidoglycan DD-metalloendopeptidase family protein [Pyrinomonadaceae bacterium]
MKWARNPRARLILAAVAILVAIVTFVVRLSRVSRFGNRTTITWSRNDSPHNITPANSAERSAPNNSGSPPAFPSPASMPSSANQASPTIVGTPPELIIPVAGVRPDQLRDTFSDARAEGRVHDAIDIPAPLGTPVVAAADGTIIKLFHSDRGGTTIYQLSSDSRFVFYYAHLDRYAEGLAEGHLARQGENIAYVGDTGNAGAGNYHLHFSIALVSDPKKYWQGVNINPYPLLNK